MQFIRQALPGYGAHAVALELGAQLAQGKRVAWLVAGGSVTALVVQVMSELPEEFTRQLTILPAYERYGKNGHDASVVTQLQRAGFQIKQATFVQPLDGNKLEVTTEHYAQAVRRAFDGADSVMAVLGIGESGRIAGITPHALPLTSPALVASYSDEAGPVITLTPVALRCIDQAYLFAYGRSKRAALDRLCDGDISISEQPAQVLRDLRAVYIYNDQLDDRNA